MLTPQAPAPALAAPAAVDMTVTDAQFTALAALVQRRFGIYLSEDKRGLVQGRLQRVVRAHGESSFQDFYDKHLHSPSREILGEVVDHLTTNHTHFWREAAHFDLFTQVVLPEAIRRHRSDRDLRVWCAAASYGQEPYTLLMLMHQVLGSDYPRWRAGVLATDLSAQALEVARAGVYRDADVGSLPKALRDRWMTQRGDGDWEMDAALKQDATFRRFNLVTPRFPFKKRFDAIFLRNVMIYFRDDLKTRLLNQMADALVSGGVLFVGHSESLRGLTTRLQPVRPGMYRKDGP